MATSDLRKHITETATYFRGGKTIGTRVWKGLLASLVTVFGKS